MSMAAATDVVLFAAALLVLCLFVLTAAGMFPAEHRPSVLNRTAGRIFLYATIAVMAALALHLIGFALGRLAWYVVVIVTGLVVLFSPGLHQLLPDALRNGRSGLAAFTGAGLAFHILLWIAQPGDPPAAM